MRAEFALVGQPTTKALIAEVFTAAGDLMDISGHTIANDAQETFVIRIEKSVLVSAYNGAGRSSVKLVTFHHLSERRGSASKHLLFHLVFDLHDKFIIKQKERVPLEVISQCVLASTS